MFRCSMSVGLVVYVSMDACLYWFGYNIESRHLVESPLSGTKILTQLYTGSYVDQNSHKISFQMDLQSTHKKRTKELKRL
jgi:hypothetical protein